MISKEKVILVILDGFGIPSSSDNVISLAYKPFFDWISKNSIYTKLKASGTSVGLPDGIIGNSEVGHMNIGAGKVVQQYSKFIYDDMQSGLFFKKESLLNFIEKIKSTNGDIHLMGLLSDGMVHSSIDQLEEILSFLKNNTQITVYLHIFSDGRDSDYKSVKKYITQIEPILSEKVKIASIIGRYYAMDRDTHLERTTKAFDLIKSHKGKAVSNILDAVNDSYSRKIYDEFIEPYYIENTPPIRENDGIFFFNFREDRARQLTKMFLDNTNNTFLAMVKYLDEDNLEYIYDRIHVQTPIGDVISNTNLYQFRIAESEKYAHVTYFFNGGREEAYKGEDRLVIPSLRIPTYDMKPQMRAYDITREVISKIHLKKYSFIVVNFANPDMVGHTGNFQACKMAIECIDKCLQKIYTITEKEGYDIIITADHGNAEALENNGKVHKEHTTSLVPFILKNKKVTKGVEIQEGILADIAPTILNILKIKKPDTMTGQNLIDNVL